VRVEVGAIHRANRGILFIDEINVLRLPSQQALLTALQDKQYAIVGQSQQSAGAMVRTDPVPCDFILVAAGNLDAVAPTEIGRDGGMHPALRSRIRGYGYEVYVNSVMDDTYSNRLKLVQFVAQEVVRDGRIPHFDMAACAEVIREAQRRSGQTGKLTLRLRELGGVVRTAGDFASAEGASLVTVRHVRQAKQSSRSLEQQITESEINKRLGKVVTADMNESLVGVAIGSAIVGTGEVGEPAGLIVPVEAAVVPALSRTGGAIIIGEGLKEFRGSGVENVGATLKLLKGTAIANFDLHIDATINHPDAFVQGIGMAGAVASISALEGLPIKQDTVMIGSIAVTGELRPVEATLQRIETAMKVGFRYAIVPESIRRSLLLDDYIREHIQVIYCRSLIEVLDHVLDTPTAVKTKVLATLRHSATTRHQGQGRLSDQAGHAGGRANGHASHEDPGASGTSLPSPRRKSP
jgi:Lon-like ATP-dependent protease